MKLCTMRSGDLTPRACDRHTHSHTQRLTQVTGRRVWHCLVKSSKNKSAYGKRWALEKRIPANDKSEIKLKGRCMVK